MNPYLLQRMKDDTPKFNPDLANGLATKYIPHVAEYIDKVWRAVAKDFPEGLEYLGYKRCTPFEEFFNEPRRKNDRKMIEIARSDIFLVKYEFAFHGKKLPARYMFLPFVRDAGSIALGGPLYFISPVLSDIILSYEQDNVFVKLLRDRFALRRINHNIVVDSKIETVPVVWSMIYHVNSKQRKAKKLVKAYTTLIHYLLCKYGFTQMMKEFGGCDAVVSDEAFDSNKYPVKDWIVIKSIQFKPKAMSRRYTYFPSELRVAIKRSEYTPMVKSLLAGVFYIVDNFPQRVKPEYVDSPRLWKILLGHLIFGSEVSEGKLHDDIDEHVKSLDEYVDAIMASRFKSIGMDISSIYQFFVIAIEQFNDWILSAKDRSNSLYDKELSILLDVLMPITSAIFTLHFKLKSSSKKTLVEKDIIDSFNRYLKPRVIFKLTDQINGVSNMSYSGDNKCINITNTMVPQKKTGGSNRDSQRLDDPTKRLHVSFAEVGSFINLSSSNITGENKVNLMLQIDEYGKIIRDENMRQWLDSIQANIQRE